MIQVGGRPYQAAPLVEEHIAFGVEVGLGLNQLEAGMAVVERLHTDLRTWRRRLRILIGRLNVRCAGGRQESQPMGLMRGWISMLHCKREREML
jgi:hypothetical protein